MEELETNEELSINDLSEDTCIPENVETETTSTSSELIEYKEVEEPCVSLTIIGENQPTVAEVFVKRGIKYSIKAFFSAIVLTIMNMFI